MNDFWVRMELKCLEPSLSRKSLNFLVETPIWAFQQYPYLKVM